MYPTAHKHERIYQVFPTPFAEGRFRDRPEKIVLQRIGALLRLKPMQSGKRSAGLNPGFASNPGVIRRVEIGIMEDRSPRIPYSLAKICGVIFDPKLGGDTFDAHVFGELKLSFDDHAKCSVATDRTIK